MGEQPNPWDLLQPQDVTSRHRGAKPLRHFFAGIRDIVGGRAGSYESVLREAKETALKEMSDHATQLGANAVIAIDLDYETVGGSGSMLMVTAAGTAVRYQ